MDRGRLVWCWASSLLRVLDRGFLVWAWADSLLGVGRWLLELLLGVSRWLLLELLLLWGVLSAGGGVGSGVLRLLGVLLNRLVRSRCWATDGTQLVLFGSGGGGGGASIAALADGCEGWKVLDGSSLLYWGWGWGHTGVDEGSDKGDPDECCERGRGLSGG